MIALILMDTFCERFGMTDVGAASEAGIVVGFNEKSIRTWKNDYKNGGEFSESRKGKHSPPYVLDDEECKDKTIDSVSVPSLRKYYREYHRAYRKGKSGGLEVESAVKLYKSDDRVPETESV